MTLKQTTTPEHRASASMLGDRRVAQLRARFRGDLLRPGDDGYDAARRIWNGMIDRRPALIARCTGTADVIAAVRFAREHDLLLAIRSGGHNVAGTALCDDGMVLDLSAMKGIHVDPARRTARIQPGVTNGDFDHETQAFGLTTTTGIASTTGLAGLTLGGGIGWLMGAFGLTCDNLVSADLVTADGEPRTASATQHEDLFWALRGGGGNLGVVTSFEYGLHPLGPLAAAGVVLHAAERAPEVLRFCRDYLQTAPAALGAIINLRRAPAASWVPADLHGQPILAIIACYAGPVEEGLDVLRPLKEFGPPLLEMIEPKPYVSHQRFFDASVPPGLRYYWKSHYLGGLSDAVIDTLVAHAWNDPSPASFTLLARMGGAVRHTAADATAFGHRDARQVLNINAVWTEPQEDESHIHWARAFSAAMEPLSTGGVYVNFLGNEGEDRVRAAYGMNYNRLVAVKTAYDPTNFFRVNQNVRPSETSGP